MSEAVERARRIMGLYGEDFAAYVALRDLLAEIDSGVWLDTRELEALRESDYQNVTLIHIAPAFYGGRRPWQVQIGRDMTPVNAATAADAVRAAREAT